MQRESLVMTVIGKDRPGLVAALAAIIDRHGGNWEESRMVELEGEFAGLVHVHVPGDRAGELEKALGGLPDLSVTVARAPAAEPSPGDSHVMTLEVVGQDRPGIVHQLSTAVAARGVNIEEISSELKSAPMAGGTMFQATARLRAPKSVRLDELQADLEDIADDLMVDIEFDEPS